MNHLSDHLQQRLDAIKKQSLLRRLRELDSPQGIRVRHDGRDLVNFSSNDYLGLSNHPALKEAAIRAVDRFGAGAGASRLICGSLKPFHELEEALADFKMSEACLTFSTGYAAAVGCISAVIESDDIVIIDKLVHASIVDAARLSGAKLRVFKHNDLNDLQRILEWADEQNRPTDTGRRNVLIVTESVFSMDGDVAPLKEIVALKDRHGAWLMVDEAHATGTFGKRRSGLIEHLGLSGRVEIQMGTLGKAIGAAGGFICGSRKLIDLLINSARSFIFSTAPVPASAAAAKAGIELIQGNEGGERSARLKERVAESRKVILPIFESSELESPAREARARVDGDPSTEARDRPLTRRPNTPSPKDGQDTFSSPILPLILGDESAAVDAADALRELGFLIPAIRYPSVARGRARLRMTVTAGHSNEEIDTLGRALKTVVNHNS